MATAPSVPMIYKTHTVTDILRVGIFSIDLPHGTKAIGVSLTSPSLQPALILHVLEPEGSEKTDTHIHVVSPMSKIAEGTTVIGVLHCKETNTSYVICW